MLAPDFIQKFEERYAKLPPDWQMVYVGWVLYGKDKQPLMIDNGISIRLPSATHAYLVKKSILKDLCDMLLPIQTPLDLTIIYKFLPKIKYYVFDPSLVQQRSYLNLADPVWLSLTYDWKNDHYGCKSAMLKEFSLKDGWYLLEHNETEKWIWSQNDFSINLPKNATGIIIECSVPVANAVIVNTGKEQRKISLSVGDNVITIDVEGGGEIKASMEERFVPAERSSINTDTRTLGICLKKVSLRMGTQIINVNVSELARKAPPPMSFKL